MLLCVFPKRCLIVKYSCLMTYLGQNWTCLHLWAVALVSAQRISISAHAPLLIHDQALTFAWYLPPLSFLAPAVREERKWEQTSIWLRGCGWIEWKCGKQLNIGICLYFSCADEGKKWPSCFNTFHYFRFVVELFWLHHSDWLIEIETVFHVSPSFCLLWPWQMAGHLAFCQSLGLWVSDSKDLQFKFMLAWFWNNSIDLFQLKFTLKGIVN